MSMLWLLRKAPDHKPAIIRHAGIRWEVDEKAVPYVMSRKDWTFGTLRKECAGKMIKTKETRLVFTERILQEDVFIKALFFDRFNVRLRSLFGRCRTRKEWENHHIALSRGIPTIRPLALGELKKGLLVHEAVLLLEGRVDLLNMNQWRRIKGRERDDGPSLEPVSYTHLRAHETPEHLVCRLLLEKKKRLLTGANIVHSFAPDIIHD